MGKTKPKITNVTDQTQNRRLGKNESVVIVKEKAKPRGRPFQKGNTANPNPFKSKAELGGELDPRIAPNGRPRVISDAYKSVMQATYPIELVTDDERRRIELYTQNAQQDITYAEKIALAVSAIAAEGDVSAAREIRTTLEGDKLALQTWQQEVVDALRRKEVTPQQVIDQLGFEDAETILIAAGVVVVSAPPRPQTTQDDTTQSDIVAVDADAP